MPHPMCTTASKMKACREVSRNVADEIPHIQRSMTLGPRKDERRKADGMPRWRLERRRRGPLVGKIEVCRAVVEAGLMRHLSISAHCQERRKDERRKADGCRGGGQRGGGGARGGETHQPSQLQSEPDTFMEFIIKHSARATTRSCGCYGHTPTRTPWAYPSFGRQ